jgi:hypothetical protein
MDVYLAKRLLRLAVRNLSAEGTTDELLFPLVPLDQQWFIEWVATMDDDNTITSWYPFIRTPSGDYPLKQPLDTAADTRHGLKLQTWLTGGERLGVKIIGATTNDDLYAWLVGHWRFTGE